MNTDAIIMMILNDLKFRNLFLILMCLFLRRDGQLYENIGNASITDIDI